MTNKTHAVLRYATLTALLLVALLAWQSERRRNLLVEKEARLLIDYLDAKKVSRSGLMRLRVSADGGWIVEADRVASEIFGYAYGDLSNVPMRAIFVSDKQAHGHADAIERLAAESQGRPRLYISHRVIKTRDGKQVPIYINAFFVPSELPEMIASVSRQNDIVVGEF